MANQLYIVVFISIALGLNWKSSNTSSDQKSELEDYIKDFDLDRSIIQESGCTSIEDFVDKTHSKKFLVLKTLEEKAFKIKQYLILRSWLKEEGLLEAAIIFANHVGNIRNLSFIDDVKLETELGSKLFRRWTRAKKFLPVSEVACSELSANLWLKIKGEVQHPMSKIQIFICSLIATSVIYVVPYMIKEGFKNERRAFLGRYKIKDLLQRVVRYLTFLMDNYLLPFGKKYLTVSKGKALAMWLWILLMDLLNIIQNIPFDTYILPFLSKCIPFVKDQPVSLDESQLEPLHESYLLPSNCKVIFYWTEPQIVGCRVSFEVELYQNDKQPYSPSKEDDISIEITQGTHKINYSIGPRFSIDNLEWLDEELIDNLITVVFSVTRSGKYHISVKIGMTHIPGSPFIKEFLSDRPDPKKTCLIHPSSTVVGSEDTSIQLFIEPRDKYDNLCMVHEDNTTSVCQVGVVEASSGKQISNSFHWEYYAFISRLALVLKFSQKGCYRVTVSCGGIIQNGDVHVIVLNQKESCLVQKNITKNIIKYEAELLALNEEKFLTPKKVHCTISPKQLTVVEYKWNLFREDLAIFCLSPSVKFKFQSRQKSMQGKSVLSIDVGCLQEIELLTPHRNIIAATISQILLKSTGNVETIRDKEYYFDPKVRNLHLKHFYDKMYEMVAQGSLINSTFKEIKNCSVSEQYKYYEKHFMAEGIDWIGLRNEWLELVRSPLFDAEKLIFQSIKTEQQGLMLIVVGALADKGVQMGVKKEHAHTLAARMLLRAAKKLLETRLDSASTKEDLSSLNSASLLAVQELEKNNITSAFVSAVEAATQESKEGRCSL